MNIMAQLIAIAKDFSAKMQKKNMAAFAGSTCYFFIISFIPLLIIITSAIPYTSLTEEDLIAAITGMMPDFANDIVTKFINEAYEQSTAIFSISAVAAIWAGALGMLAIIRGLNCIYDVEERRNYFMLRLVAAVYTLAMIVIMMGMLFLLVFEKVLRGLVITAFPWLGAPLGFLTNFRFVVVIGAATFAFAMIYTYVPSAKMKFVYQLPGAVFSAVVWYLFSVIFSVYVNLTNGYSLYGSLATPMIMMIWLYCCIYIFLIGAFINRFFHPAVKVLYDDHHKKTVRKKAKKKSTRTGKKHKTYNEFG